VTPRGLTLQQAAKYCGIGPSTYRRWVENGVMPDTMPGTRRYDRLAIDDALDKMSQRNQGSGSAYDAWKAAG
jgi:excisionase family DNA binding protein